MTGEEKTIMAEAKHEAWCHEMRSLNWGFSGEGLTQRRPWSWFNPNPIDGKDSGMDKNKNKKRGYTEKAEEAAFWVMASIIGIGLLTLIIIILI